MSAPLSMVGDEEGETLEQALSRASDVLAATEMLLLEQQRGPVSTASGWSATQTDVSHRTFNAAAPPPPPASSTPSAPASAAPVSTYTSHAVTTPRVTAAPAPSTTKQLPLPQAQPPTPNPTRPSRTQEPPSTPGAPTPSAFPGGPGGRAVVAPMPAHQAPLSLQVIPVSRVATATPPSSAAGTAETVTTGVTATQISVAVFFVELNRNIAMEVDTAGELPALMKRMREQCAPAVNKTRDWLELFFLERQNALDDGRWFRVAGVAALQEGMQLLFRVRHVHSRDVLPDGNTLPPVETTEPLLRADATVATVTTADTTAVPTTTATPSPPAQLPEEDEQLPHTRRSSLLPSLQGAAAERPEGVRHGGGPVEGSRKSVLPIPAATPPTVPGSTPALKTPSEEDTDPKIKLGAFHDTIVNGHKRILELEEELARRSLPIPSGWEQERVAVLEHPLSAHLKADVGRAKGVKDVKEGTCYVSRPGSGTHRIARIRVVGEGVLGQVVVDSAQVDICNVAVADITHFGPYVDTTRDTMRIGLSVTLATRETSWVLVMTAAETATRWIEWASRFKHISTSVVTYPEA